MGGVEARQHAGDAGVELVSVEAELRGEAVAVTDTLVAPLPPAPGPSNTEHPSPLDELSALAAAAQERAKRRLVVNITTRLEAMLAPFDDEDRALFGRELQAALSDSQERLEALLREWAVTSAALGDPLNREVLLGEADEADFIEVHRPE